ncbi:hypothetical protein D9M71_437540 [compost metagenome]
MAAVAGHIDDFIALGDALYALDVVDLDAVVDLVPEPAEHHFQEADDSKGVVRGDLVAIAQRLAFRLGQWDVFPFGFVEDGLAHQWVMDQPLDQVAPVGNIGTDDRGFQCAEMHAQQALDSAYRSLVAQVLLNELAQADGGAELHAGLAAQDQNADQATQTPGDRPAVGEQQLPGARFAGRRLPPEDADGNDLGVFFSVIADSAYQPRQGRRRAAFVLAAQPVGVRGQVEKARGLQQAAQRNRQHRARQPGLGTFSVKHRQVAQRWRLQDVEHRTAAVQVQAERRLVDGFRAYPEIQQSTQGAKNETTERGASHTAFCFWLKNKNEHLLGLCAA